MKADYLTYKRARNTSLLGLGIQLVLGPDPTLQEASQRHVIAAFRGAHFTTGWVDSERPHSVPR